jgi:hypothetical protein
VRELRNCWPKNKKKKKKVSKKKKGKEKKREKRKRKARKAGSGTILLDAQPGYRVASPRFLPTR